MEAQAHRYPPGSGGNNTRPRRRSDWALKRVLCSACTSTVCFFSVLQLLLSLLHLQDPTIPEESPRPSPREIPSIKLLVWVHPFGENHPLPNCWEQYRIHGCTVTDDVHAYRQADAVIIHHREISLDTAPLPPQPRPRAQKWIWMNHESPSNTLELWRFDGLFNLTLSYRTDSNIFVPYGYLIPRVRDTQNGLAQRLDRMPTAHRRVRLVAWVISHWSESQERVAFYRKLSRYVTVDVYGKAGIPLKAGRGKVLQLLHQYHFYLALENSQHTDYITEKLWNAVQAGAVPVVLGPSRQNYERFLPPEAFIHVDDFPTVRGLARYLLRMRKNPSLMRRHLFWRRSYRIHIPTFWGEHYCTACTVVRRTLGQTKVVSHLEDWFQS